jgi:hypothetical protein
MDINNTYRVVVYLAVSELTDDGVVSIETPVARYVTESMTADDAVRRVADRLEAEEQF